jgi:F-type H+-transporting ATPase subunit a
VDIQTLSPDDAVVWRWGFVSLNYTILYTWVVMGVLSLVTWLATRRLTREVTITRWQNFLEIVVDVMKDQIRDVTRHQPEKLLPFIGTLFLFIVTANLLSVVPGFYAPTSSLSTTTALAICVLVAVPIFGIANQGLWRYLKLYVQPTPFMLPFNIIGEVSRTLALSVRLFGNMMSGAKIAAILLAITPLFVPIVMHTLGLLTGVIQAYIFAMLALVYIASATQAHSSEGPAGAHRDGTAAS